MIAAGRAGGKRADRRRSARCGLSPTIRRPGQSGQSRRDGRICPEGQRRSRSRRRPHKAARIGTKPPRFARVRTGSHETARVRTNSHSFHGGPLVRNAFPILALHSQRRRPKPPAAFFGLANTLKLSNSQVPRRRPIVAAKSPGPGCVTKLQAALRKFFLVEQAFPPAAHSHERLCHHERPTWPGAKPDAGILLRPSSFAGQVLPARAEGIRPSAPGPRGQDAPRGSRAPWLRRCCRNHAPAGPAGQAGRSGVDSIVRPGDGQWQ